MRKGALRRRLGFGAMDGPPVQEHLDRLGEQGLSLEGLANHAFTLHLGWPTMAGPDVVAVGVRQRGASQEKRPLPLSQAWIPGDKTQQSAGSAPPVRAA